jgi:uncharacterized C2H2 Zn-finger protein
MGPAFLPVKQESNEHKMVLRCPRCSELTFYGRPQVLGELVVCARCESPFSWRDAGREPDNENTSPVKPKP